MAERDQNAPVTREAARPQPGLLLRLHLAEETDVLIARQRAKQVATLIGFDVQEQTRIATAVSEIARNAFEYATGGVADFYLDQVPQPRVRIVIADCGRGIKPLDRVLAGTYKSPSGMGLGIVGARRLMDSVDIESSPNGTTVTLIKHVLRRAEVALPSPAHLVASLSSVPAFAPAAAREENRDLLALLTELRAREVELHRLNQELEETNRGVLVLYAELEGNAQAVQQASEMKTRFLSGVTHELRTPLNSVVSLSRLLLHRTDGELNAEQEKQVQFILRSAQNLTEMVNDLLDLAKVEAGKITVKLSEFSVADTFAALRGMFRPLSTKERVELIFENPDEPGQPAMMLRTDEGKLAQILRNFIANALKFTNKGTVVVSAKPDGGNSIVFTVADTGIGIAPEHFDIVMQEWGQVESATHDKQKGSGLGLPLSLRFAEMLGGRIWFESTLGRGSSFHLSLPALLEPEIEAPLAATALPHVLMADDDEVSRYLLRRRLESLTTARIEEVTSGQDCLDSVARSLPAILFLDLIMPGLGGFDVARQLRANPKTRDLPIVLHTSKTLSAADLTAVASFDLTYIPKREDDSKDARHTQDRTMQFERALLQVGLSNLHQGSQE